jgi:hypothetical protein
VFLRPFSSKAVTIAPHERQVVASRHFSEQNLSGGTWSNVLLHAKQGTR